MAAAIIGSIYFHGEGVAVDYKRALPAYKTGAEGGDAHCQNQLGSMLSGEAYGLELDYEQAVVWLEKAAAQDDPAACNNLAFMAVRAQGQAPSWRRARDYWQRAVDLGHAQASENMQPVADLIRQVANTLRRGCT